jgi:hypothetical protein
MKTVLMPVFGQFLAMDVPVCGERAVIAAIAGSDGAGGKGLPGGGSGFAAFAGCRRTCRGFLWRTSLGPALATGRA